MHLKNHENPNNKNNYGIIDGGSLNILLSN